jgi:2-polyprenyl-6-methoxyphenol hydroxylase-like FAD-dependent oxidoreductase
MIVSTDIASIGRQHMPNPILRQAVIIGAGMGGLAAAKAVAPYFEKVVVFERDWLPDEPAARSGTPQARHTHGLLAGGHRALEHLFPGIELDLVAAGAVRMRLRRDMRFEVPGFDPLPPRDLGFDQLALSRPMLELVCRRRVEREPNIEFRPRSRVTDLVASRDGHGVTGLRFLDARGIPGNVSADLVVDASGRASPTLRFLEATGSPNPATIEIGVDQAYATAIFETPDDAPTDWLGVVHLPTPPGSSRFGIILPMEGGRWSVSLCVNHGEAPPADIDAFMDFATSFRMPTIYNAIRGAKCVGEIARFGMPSSVRRAFDRLDLFPRGLVPLGDSICRFPPVQGQGMSVAAQECCVLSNLLEARQGRDDPLDGLAEAFFTEIQPILETPWAVAMNDFVYPQTRGERPPDFETRLHYAQALMRLAAEDYETDRIVFEVRALLRPQSTLREPALASRVKAKMAPAEVVSPTFRREPMSRGFDLDRRKRSKTPATV